MQCLGRGIVSLRVSREKRKPSFFCMFSKSTCSGTLNSEGGNGKKIPVFVSKFGELVFNFPVFFSSLLLSLFQKETCICLQNVGGQKEQRRIYITMETGAFVKNELHSSSIIPEY